MERRMVESGSIFIRIDRIELVLFTIILLEIKQIYGNPPKTWQQIGPGVKKLHGGQF
jgi:hypothetical protein